MSGSGSTKKYKGVRKRKWGKFVSEIRELIKRPGARTNRIWLGSFGSAEEAAHAFDAAQICTRGREANLNFPDWDYWTPPGITGRYSVEEIQAAAACAAAQYAGRPFNIDNFNPQSDDSESDEAPEINFNYDDPYNLCVNDHGNRVNDNDDDDDEEEDDSDDDSDDERLWP